MKRALFVSYYFPPLGGVGAQRPLKFAKYLRQFGWNVDVLTVDPKIGLKLDPSLAKDVPAETLVRAAATAETRFMGLDRLPLLKYWRLLLWPDAAALWKPHAVRLGLEMARERSYDLIFSSAPPYSVHLIAETLQRELALPWVADFRDPWSQNRSLHRVQPWRRTWDRRAETRILAKADHVLTVTEAMRKDLLRDFALAPERVTAITNGFDPEEFPPAPPPQNETMTLLFTGSAYGEYNPMALLEGLDRFAKQNPEARFRLRMIGAVSAWMRAHHGDSPFAFPIEFMDFIPHAEIPRQLQAADLLLLSYPSWMMAGIPVKLFEYMASGRPVLGLFPAGAEAEQVIRETQCGIAVNDPDHVAEAFTRCYRLWQEGEPLSQPLPDRIARYDRRLQAQALAEVFDRIRS
jgi:glycosyltransferase involved in cell wall biosynthesis